MLLGTGIVTLSICVIYFQLNFLPAKVVVLFVVLSKISELSPKYNMGMFLIITRTHIEHCPYVHKTKFRIYFSAYIYCWAFTNFLSFYMIILRPSRQKISFINSSLNLNYVGVSNKTLRHNSSIRQNKFWNHEIY